MFSLFKNKNYLALFLAQFFGAFNDNFFKATIVAFVTFGVGRDALPSGLNQIIPGIAIALMMLPFFLFSSTAGQIADKYSKTTLIKWIKFAEIIILFLGAFGLYHLCIFSVGDTGFGANLSYLFWIIFILIVLFLMGTQSAFFGPLKYSVLPEFVSKKNLVSANGLIEAGTFIGILLGMILGGIVGGVAGSDLISTTQAVSETTVLSLLVNNILLLCSTPWFAGVLLLLMSLLGFCASLLMAKTSPGNSQVKIDYNIFRATTNIVRHVKASRTILLSILGISWFWLLGSVIMSQLPMFVKESVYGSVNVYTFLLVVFSLGIGIGSILCNFLVRGEITSKYVPFTAILMTIFIADIAFSDFSHLAVSEQSLIQFISSFSGVRLSISIFLLSIFGGIFVVPLQTILQSSSSDKNRARTIAVNNIVNSLFMFLGSAVSTLVLYLGLGIENIFLLIAIANTIVAIYICAILPDHILREIGKIVLQSIYNIEVKGLENYKKIGCSAVIIANHVSFLDPAILAVFLPEKPMFAINTNIANKFWVKPFLHFVKAFPIDPTNPMAAKSLIQQVRLGNRLVIFPEGRITTTGSLMKIYPGPSIIADKTQADILPVCIEGAEYSIFSYFSSKIRRVPRAKIIVKILPPTKLTVPADITGRKRRTALTDEMYKILSDMKYQAQNTNRDLFENLKKSAKKYGFKTPIVEDITRKPISYFRLMVSAFAFAKVLEKRMHSFQQQKYVGLMMPNAIPSLISFFALICVKKVPAMLNFSMGIKDFMATTEVCQLKHVVTSKIFIRRMRLDNYIEKLENAGISIIYLEDFKNEIWWNDKLVAIFKTLFFRQCYKPTKATEPAVVLFTSGSEGTPKAVVLSHKNIVTNTHQIITRIDTSPNDKVLNILPIFHSFGLTAGTFLPLYFGIPSFLYPSPLHYRIISELAYDINATILFGTDTFFAGYAKIAHPYDFYSLRYAIAGAEKLKLSTREIWAEKFGVRILEGYGATEASPILAVNTPLYNKRETVGQFINGMNYKLKDVEGITDGKRLFVHGPNIMLGYINIDKPGEIQPLEGGWYDTGDIVEVDDEGFVHIKGRAKRFSKIAGEMVSLSAVEAQIAKLWPEFRSAVVAVPDEKKGEKLILWTTNIDAMNQDTVKEQVIACFKQQGLSELSIPKDIRYIPELPLMGSGKINYVSLMQSA